jgi:large subunit ribosomal protein L22
MQAVAKVKNVRYGVRKLRRVVDLVRGKSVDEAFAMLSILHTQTKGAPLVENALKSAVANFKQKSAAPVTAEELVVKTITADGGTIMKRIHPRSQGRAFRIEKPLSHITVVVANKEKLKWVRKLIRMVFVLASSAAGNPSGMPKTSLPIFCTKISCCAAT